MQGQTGRTIPAIGATSVQNRPVPRIAAVGEKGKEYVNTSTGEVIPHGDHRRKLLDQMDKHFPGSVKHLAAGGFLPGWPGGNSNQVDFDKPLPTNDWNAGTAPASMQPTAQANPLGGFSNPKAGTATPAIDSTGTPMLASHGAAQPIGGDPAVLNADDATQNAYARAQNMKKPLTTAAATVPIIGASSETAQPGGGIMSVEGGGAASIDAQGNINRSANFDRSGGGSLSVMPNTFQPPAIGGVETQNLASLQNAANSTSSVPAIGQGTDQALDAFGKPRVDKDGNPVMSNPMKDIGNITAGTDYVAKNNAPAEAVKAKLGFLPDDYFKNPEKYQQLLAQSAVDLTGQGHLLGAQAQGAYQQGLLKQEGPVKEAEALKLRAESVYLPQAQKARIDYLTSQGNYDDARAALAKAEMDQKNFQMSPQGQELAQRLKGHDAQQELEKAASKAYQESILKDPTNIQGAYEAAEGVRKMGQGLIPIPGTPAVPANPGHLFGLIGGSPGKAATPTTWVPPGAAPPAGFNPTGKTSGGKPVYSDGKQFWTP